MKKDDREDYIGIAAGCAVITLILVGFLVFKAVSNNNDTGDVNASTTTSTASAEAPPTDKNANGCYTPSTVRKHYGETACVDFDVGYTFETGGGTKFIDEKEDYQNGFVVYIPRDSTFSTVDLSQFDGKTVSVTGYIQEYNGYPEIEATQYDQVKVYQ